MLVVDEKRKGLRKSTREQILPSRGSDCFDYGAGSAVPGESGPCDIRSIAAKADHKQIGLKLLDSLPFFRVASEQGIWVSASGMLSEFLREVKLRYTPQDQQSRAACLIGNYL